MRCWTRLRRYQCRSRQCAKHHRIKCEPAKLLTASPAAQTTAGIGRLAGAIAGLVRASGRVTASSARQRTPNTTRPPRKSFRRLTWPVLPACAARAQGALSAVRRWRMQTGHSGRSSGSGTQRRSPPTVRPRLRARALRASARRGHQMLGTSSRAAAAVTIPVPCCARVCCRRGPDQRSAV